MLCGVGGGRLWDLLNIVLLQALSSKYIQQVLHHLSFLFVCTALLMVSTLPAFVLLLVEQGKVYRPWWDCSNAYSIPVTGVEFYVINGDMGYV